MESEGPGSAASTMRPGTREAETPQAAHGAFARQLFRDLVHAPERFLEVLEGRPDLVRRRVVGKLVEQGEGFFGQGRRLAFGGGQGGEVAELGRHHRPCLLRSSAPAMESMVRIISASVSGGRQLASFQLLRRPRLT